MIKQDIAIVFDPDTQNRDIAIGDDGDLQSVDDFSTSLGVSLFTDKRVSASEVSQAVLRRGWIGDVVPRTEFFKIGSKMWLFEQSRRDELTLAALADAAEESLQWIITSGQANGLEVNANLNGFGGVSVDIDFFIENNVVKRYFSFWNNTEEKDI